MAKTNLNLLALSDIFRRGAGGGGSELDFTGFLREDLVAKTRQLAVYATYISGEYEDTHSVNRPALEKIADTLKDMDRILKQMGITTARLPFSKFNPIGEIIKAQILSPNGEYYIPGIEKRLCLQQGQYRPDSTLAVFPVQQDRHTIFDEGIRGVADIRRPHF
mgnify:CR=1 FL=1